MEDADAHAEHVDATALAGGGWGAPREPLSTEASWPESTAENCEHQLEIE